MLATSDLPARRPFATRLARPGRLDVLVNNIGITGFESGADAQDPEHVSLDAWRAVNGDESRRRYVQLLGGHRGVMHAAGHELDI
jgi:hypothetical protein